MVKNISFLVTILIVIMDIIAGILGIEADFSQNKVSHLKAWSECRHPSNQALRLGIAAMVILLMAHVIANLLGGCICIRSKEELNRASPNEQLAADYAGCCIHIPNFWNIVKHKIKKTLWSSTSSSSVYWRILCFIHGLFLVAYYVSAIASIREEEKQSRRGSHENKPNQHGAEA